MEPLVFSRSSDYEYVKMLLPCVVMFVLVCIQLLTFCMFINRVKYPSADNCWNDHIVTPCVEQVFDDIFKVYESKGKTEKAYIVFKHYKSSPFYTMWLFFLLLSLAAIAFIQFWNDFLLEESYTCSTNPTLACFSASPSTYEEKLDCSNMSYLEENNITAVVCFKFVYQLGHAAGAAVGVVTMNALIMCFIQFGLLHLSQCCKAPITIAIQFAAALLTIGATTVLYLLQQSYSTSLHSWYPFIRTYFNGYIIAVATLSFPWFSFKKINDDDEANTIQYHSCTITAHRVTLQMY